MEKPNGTDVAVHGDDDIVVPTVDKDDHRVAIDASINIPCDDGKTTSVRTCKVRTTIAAAAAATTSTTKTVFS